MRKVLVLVAVLASALAGCLAPQPAALSAATAPVRGVDDLVHDLGEILPVEVPVSGGVALRGTVYLPDVAAGVKVPVVVDMGPYFGNLAAETDVYSKEHPPRLAFEHLLRRGYAIAFVSVRGTGLSGGCFMIGGPEERADVAAAVEWLAAQPWSNGAVGMMGASYDGTTPWEGLVSGAAPSLKAIVPIESITDFYRYSFYEGVPVGGGARFNTYYLEMVDVTYGAVGVPPRPPALDKVPTWAAQQPSNVCPEQVEVYASPYQTYLDGVHGPHWDARDMSAMLAPDQAPALVVHGFKDFNVKMDHAQTLWGKLPEGSRMLLGQWAHNFPWRNTFDEEMSWHEFNATIDSFFDAYLKGDAAALAEQQAAPRVLVQDSANVTHAFAEWPPAAALDAPWYLGGSTLAIGPAAEGEARLVSQPARQVLTTPVFVNGLPNPHRGAGAMLPSGAVAFVSEPLAEDALFVGNPHVDLRVSVDRPSGSLEARLYEVDGDEWELVSLGWQKLATRETRERASDVPTGTPMDVRILLTGIAQRVEAGHALVLVLSPEQSGTYSPHVQATTFTVQLGGEEGARLVLPSLPAKAT